MDLLVDAILPYLTQIFQMRKGFHQRNFAKTGIWTTESNMNLSLFHSSRSMNSGFPTK